MAAELLLDTGALVTLLDRRQAHHRRFVAFFEGWRGPIVSTEAVLTEATHLLGRVPRGRQTCVDFFLSGAAVLAPVTTTSLRRCGELMRKYADQPMDYADASLVALGEELGTRRVFTTDRKDFSVYRLAGRRAFEILPA